MPVMSSPHGIYVKRCRGYQNTVDSHGPAITVRMDESIAIAGRVGGVESPLDVNKS